MAMVPKSSPAGQLRFLAIVACTLCSTLVSGQTWRIVPQLSVRETYSDNIDLAASSSAQSRAYSDISTGLLVERLGPRVSFLFDYRLRSYIYSGESRLNNTQNFLNSRAAFELVDNWMFVDARANITQQNRSAFGAPVAGDGTGVNANQAETRTYQISPYVRGTLSDRAIYQFRFNASESRTAEDVLADSRTSEWLGLISSAPTAGRLGWMLDGSAQTVRSDDIGTRKNDRARVSLIYPLLPTLSISAIAGYEENSLASAESRSGSSNGVGLEWNPSPRTRLVAVGQRRFFGNSHDVNFSHRTALTSWRFSSSRDVVLSQNIASAANQISVTELISDILASSIPDPAARSAAVSQRLGQTGIPIASTTSSGFLTSRPTLTRRHDASVAILGVRSTISFSLSRRDQLALGDSSGAADSFSLSDDIRQTIAATSWVYRLTPLSSFTLALSKTKSEGLSSLNFESEQRLHSLYFNTSLGPRTTVSVGVRRDHFDSTRATSYRENSVTGSLSVRF
ncbi:MAG: TIGR03016 family PEP-CTERM system-associated outer membrane protein [Betaproteobacteria bacterium]|nr:TIGR03016 family PEP-CTERM system-associated outer membrane protein [Betaproteobacteria bacterium]